MSRDTEGPTLDQDGDNGEDEIDPDVGLITDYLDHDLSPADRSAVEHRLATDYAFYMKVSPLIGLWRMPAGFRDELARELEADEAAAPEKAPAAAPKPFLYRPIPELRGRSSEEPPRLPLNAPEEGASPALDEATRRQIRRGEFWYTSFLRSMTLMNVAAAAALLISVSTLAYFRIGSTPKDPVITLPVVRASTAGMRDKVVVETGPDQQKEIQLRGGSLVLLRPNSRLTYENTLAPAPGARLALDGEMAIDVTMKDLTLLVVTSAGQAYLTPGRYAVSCAPSCPAMLVTVGVGFASMRRDSTQARFKVSAGEKGRLPRDGSPEKVEGGSGWPELAPLKP